MTDEDSGVVPVQNTETVEEAVAQAIWEVEQHPHWLWKSATELERELVRVEARAAIAAYRDVVSGLAADNTETVGRVRMWLCSPGTDRTRAVYDRASANLAERQEQVSGPWVPESELAAARTELDEAKREVERLRASTDVAPTDDPLWNSLVAQRDEHRDNARMATGLLRDALHDRDASRAVAVQLREAHQLLRNLVGNVRGMQSDGASPERMDQALGDALEAYDRAVLSGSPQPDDPVLDAAFPPAGSPQPEGDRR